MNEPDVVFKCEICDEHKSDLSTLCSMWKTIKESFTDVDDNGKIQIFKFFYEQFKLDQRTKYINDSKKSSIDQIQKYKQSNIKAIKKE